MMEHDASVRRLGQIRAEVDAMREAMRWLLRLRGKSVSEGDLAEWTHWYESDPRNKSAFDEMQDLWMRSASLAAGSRGRARIQRLLAREGDAGRNLRISRSSPKRVLELALAASLGVLLVGGTVLIHYSRNSDRISSPAEAVPLVRARTLPDGSRVELAPGTFIRVRYTASERLVELRGGEAYFRVVHNASRPFVVSAQDLEVRDVGTAFNVRDADQRTVVMVTSGVVDVYARRSGPGVAGHGPALTRVRVTAGHEVKWDEDSKPVVAQANAQRTLSWRRGRLDYIDEPLSSVIADVNRYLRQPVQIQGRAVGELAFTGTVMTRSAQEWVRALPSEFPVKLVSTERGSLVLTPDSIETQQTSIP